MRKRCISAIIPIIVIAGLTMAECLCPSVPTYAKEAETVQSNSSSTGDTSSDNNTSERKLQDEPTSIGKKTSFDNSSDLPKVIEKKIDRDNNAIPNKVVENPKEEIQELYEEEPKVEYKEEYKEELKEVAEERYSYPVTFRILGGPDGNVEEATAFSTGYDYLDSITLIDAIDDTMDESDSDGSEDNLEEDNFTATNKIASSLKRYPSETDIQQVYPSFNPKKQYVIWYLIDGCDPDNIYVDGVIRAKTPVKEIEKKEEEVVEAFVPDVTIEISTFCDTSEFVYDGKDHYFGGFSITVKDNDPLVNSVTHFFDALGNFVTKKVNAGAKGEGTHFEHNGIHYWVNIDAAYVVAKQISSYHIPFIFDGKEIAPEEIVVKVLDDSGNVLSTMPSSKVVKPAPERSQIKVTTIKLTLEAGTTVQNYSGKTITNNNVKITSGALLEGHKLVDVVINGSQSGVGSSVNEITNFRIVDENGNDVTKYYEVNCVNGKLTLVDAKDNGKASSKTTETAPATATKDTKNSKKTIIVGGKSLEKTSAENDNRILGVSRLARMSKTFDATHVNLRFFIILTAAVTAIYLSKAKINE